MPRFQTAVGVVIEQQSTINYIVSAWGRPMVAFWYGPYEFIRGDQVIVQRVDVSKNAHIIGPSFGDTIEGMPGTTIYGTIAGSMSTIFGGGSSAPSSGGLLQFDIGPGGLDFVHLS